MRFLSFDDYTPGVIAIGGAPVGILAIGGAPLGVIAIGIGAVGVVAVGGGGAVGGAAISCGGGVGLATIVCGLGVGGYVRGVGLAFGLRANVVGSQIEVLSEDDPFPRAAPPRASDFERKKKLAVPAEDIGPKVGSGWALVTPTKTMEEEPWSITVHGEPADIALSATATLERWSAGDGPILAHIVCTRAPPRDEQGGYRRPSAPRFAASIGEVVLPSERRDDNPGLLGRRLRWIGKLIAKGVPWLACMLIAVLVILVRLDTLEMTRTAETSWTGTIRRAEGVAFPSDTQCRIASGLRSNGKTKLLASVEISCGKVVLYSSPSARCQANETLLPGSGNHYRYALTCTDEGQAADDDHAARAGLSLATQERRAVLTQGVPHPFHLDIDVDPESAERVGEPLFLPVPKSVP